MSTSDHWQHHAQWLTPVHRSEIDAVIRFDTPPHAARPLALGKFLGRSSLQRALYHMARTGIRCCALVYVEDGAQFVQQVGAQVEEIDIGDMAVCAVGSADTRELQQALADKVVIVRADFVFDRRLLEKIAAHGAAARLVAPGGEVLGLAKLKNEDARGLLCSGELQPGIKSMHGLQDVKTDSIPKYVPNMRRSFAPYWQFIEDDADLRSAADKVMDSAQKGVLDFPARYLHPIPENLLARLLAHTSITPNQITIISAILAFIGTYWFATQQYAGALFMAVVAGILDGVDGKLARIKLLSSPFGDRLDHSLDVSFEFSWYIAIGWGLYQSTGDWSLFSYGFLIVVIMLLARALSGLYLLQTGHQIHDHTSFDRTVRLFAGRRNIYVLILLIGYLSDSFLTSFYVVIIWGIATVAIYALRNIIVFARRFLPV